LLFEEVLQILEKAADIFDILEYSCTPPPPLQFVSPVFYKLQNLWCNLSALDTEAGQIFGIHIKLLRSGMIPPIYASLLKGFP